MPCAGRRSGFSGRTSTRSLQPAAVEPVQRWPLSSTFLLSAMRKSHSCRVVHAIQFPQCSCECCVRLQVRLRWLITAGQEQAPQLVGRLADLNSLHSFAAGVVLCKGPLYVRLTAKCMAHS